MSLDSDICECKSLLSSIKSERLKKVLTSELASLERENAIAIAKQQPAPTPAAAAAATPVVEKSVPAVSKGKRIEFKGYSWEQTNKNIKVRATYPKGFESIKDCTHVSLCDEDNIVVKFPCAVGEATLRVELTERPIKHSEMTIKYKNDYLLLTVPKKYEGNWQDIKRKNLEAPKSQTEKSDDPSKSLMAMMQNLYNDGDEEMKATIGKAMYDSRNKNPDQINM